MIVLADVECRAELRGRRLGGYAAVFDQTTDLGWQGQERLAQTAFQRALSSPDTDVRALYNHNPLYLLGRQSSGTLRVTVDSRGLEYEVDLPDTSYARDVRELVERGDITGASFGFVPGEWTTQGEVRTHTSVSRLVDVSPVPFPAYDGASTEARSLAIGDRRRSQLVRARYRARRTPGGVIISADR